MVKTRSWLSRLLTGASLIGAAVVLSTAPARALTFYQDRMAFDVDAFAYDANPGDYTWDVDDWAQSADLIPNNKGDGTNGPEVMFTLNDPKHNLTNVPFTVGPTTDGANNAMLAYGQTVPVVPGKYQAVLVLYDQDCGPIVHPFTFHYADGDDAQKISFEDWCYKQSPTDFYAWKADRAEKKSGIDTGTQCGVDYKFIPVNPNRILQSITLGKAPSVKAPGDVDTGGPDMVLMAMTLVSADATLPAYGTITGTVKDASGTVVANADVFIPELGLKARGGQNDGAYRIVVPSGTYHLTAIKEGDPAPDVAPLSVTVTAGGNTAQDISLGPPATSAFAEVKGTVVDASNNPVAGAAVTLLAPSGTPIQTATTSAAGAFDFKGLVPEADTVTADAPLADKPATSPVMLTGGQATSVTVTLTLLPAINLASSALPMGVAWDAAGANTSATIDPKDLSPADLAYKEDTTWAKAVTVPGDVSMDVSGTNAYFWYRLSGLTLPPAMQALQGKNVPLLLKGLEIGGNPRQDRSASDMTFFNGHLIGATSNAGDENEEATIRTYAIDPSYVNWTGTNTLALLVYTGGGPAGITGMAPTLLPLGSTQSLLSGTILDAATGQPTTAATTVTLTQPGGMAAFLTTRGIGSYSFLGVAPGPYTVAVPASATVAKGATASVTAVGGQVIKTDLTVGFPAFFEGTAADPHDDTFNGPALDMKWTDADVGMPSAAGAAAIDMGHLKQDGDGAGFNANNMESLNFLYQKITGDFAATVQVLTGPTSSDNAGAGLMVRQTTAPDDPYVAVQATGNGMVNAPYRLASASLSRGIDGGAAAKPPLWVKIRRVGGEVATYMSTDGKAATLIGVEDTDIPPDALLGTVVTSAADGALDTGTFGTFKVVPIAAVQPPAAGNGDLNGDGKVDIKDATLSLQIAVGSVTPTAAQMAAGDVNGDGKLDIKDTTLILKTAVGL